MLLASSQSLLLIFRLEIAMGHFGPNHQQSCWRYFVGSQGLDQRIAYNLSTSRAKLVMLCHAEWCQDARLDAFGMFASGVQAIRHFAPPIYH